MVYIRKHLRKGKTYFSVVETFREKERVKQRILYYIGSKKEYSEFLKCGIDSKDFISSDLENLLYQTPLSLWKLAEQLRFQKIFSSHFEKEWGVEPAIAATLMIINYATEGKSKSKLQNWYKQTFLKHFLKIPPKKINKDLLCRTMDFFTERKIEKIHREIFQYAKQKFSLSENVLFYDLTDVTFEGNCCPIAKRGYNPEALRKLQVNLGLVITEENFPVAHKVFEGNIKDVTTFEKIVSLLERTVNLSKIIFIFDRGLSSEENMAGLEKNGAKFIAGLPKKSTVKKLMLGLEESDFQKITEENYFWEKKEDERRIIIFWNKRLQQDQRKMRQETLGKMEKTLGKLSKNFKRYSQQRLFEKIGQITGKYRRFFKIEVKEEFVFCRDKKKLQQLEKIEGRCAIITNTNFTAAEILQRYRDKNLIEISFKDLKLFVDIRPVRHWKENRVLAHVFLAILAFALRSMIELKLRKKGIEMTAQTAIEKMNTVRALVAKAKVLRLTNETEETRKIAKIIEN